MKRFAGFIRKEFYHIWRDKRSLLILIGMPIVQILLFGFAITNEIREAPVAILDRSNDHVTREITDKILSSGYYKLVSRLDHEDQIERSFQQGIVKQVIVFEAEFARKLVIDGTASVQLIADATDPNTGNTLIGYTTSIIKSYQQNIQATTAAPMIVNTEARFTYNPELKGVFLFVPGLITIILMLVSAMMTSISLTREKEMGTMEVLLASPMHPAQVITAKVIPYVLLSFMNAIIILILGFTVFKVPVQGSTVLLLLECLLFIINALSLGILISTRAKTQQVALMSSLFALMLPTILLSGFIFPIENMPNILQWLSHLIPAKWFVIIIKAIMLKGVGLEIIWKETLVIILFTMVFIGASIKNFKMRLA